MLFLIKYSVNKLVPKPHCIVPSAKSWVLEAEDTLLVEAEGYDEACDKIKLKYKDVRAEQLAFTFESKNL